MRLVLIYKSYATNSVRVNENKTKKHLKPKKDKNKLYMKIN